MHNKLQYISQGNTIEEQLSNIKNVLDHGCKWVQLRFKNANAQDFYTVAEQTKVLCQSYQATFIINDKVDLAYQLDADGVHLGLDDMPIKAARNILGDKKIIGGTANTWNHIQQRAIENCNYIGLGPFRFTPTKEKLSPILGLEGYEKLLQKMKQENIFTPVIAIGGITLEDIDLLIETGLYGVAISGLLTQNPTLITTLNEKMHVNI
ncbi:thiamine phosphate synthase [Flavobacterium sp. TP390]|uniref:Thiamine-phosphate synthase n=1 Tax=Flavobacterium profundi TaxID=1774945 RepID=A0A6I4IV33_9FLAO|nr:thiamine phosphate synthase [Flavobacterium profundi]MVO10767.1 thiamine phosphate synthase [Flavobacterium profundi]